MCTQVHMSVMGRARQSADSHWTHKVSGSNIEPQACCLQNVTTSHTVVEQSRLNKRISVLWRYRVEIRVKLCDCL